MSTSANLVTTSPETLVFRDGKPFGMEGTLTGGRIPWPMPSTIAGMIRSRIGASRSTAAEDYFARGDTEEQTAKRQANIAALLKVSLRSLPVHRRFGEATWNFLFPAPADAAIFPCGHRDRELKVCRFVCQPLAVGEGCADLWSNWLLAVPLSLEKPAACPPTFWSEKQFYRWLREDFEDGEQFKPSDLGVARAERDTRIHTAISAESGTVVEGALFDSPGIRFGVSAADGDRPAELGLAVFLDGLRDGDDVTGAVHFGGERRVAYNDSDGKSFPSADELKGAWNGQQFLRLVLTSPGSFAEGWAPRWLLHDLEPSVSSSPPALRWLPQWLRHWLRRFSKKKKAPRNETPWVTVPNTVHQVRLRSAFVPGWVPLSGWNYDTHSPKRMCKIVPAGSVYVVEVRNPAASAAIAEALWGQSLCDTDKEEDHQSARDGFGIAVVGCANKLCHPSKPPP